MAKISKLSRDEVAALTSRTPRLDLSEYLAMLQGFRSGDWGRIELEPGDDRRVVRRRLTLASKQKGIALRYRASKPEDTTILFRVL